MSGSTEPAASKPDQGESHTFRCIECGADYGDHDSECSLECTTELVEVREQTACPHVTPGPVIESRYGVASEFRVCALCGAKLYD